MFPVVIQLDQFRQKSYLKRRGSAFREFGDCYEYCLVKGYEAYFGSHLWHVIEVENILAAVMEKRGQFVLVSIQFPKKSFSFQGMIEWLTNYNVILQPKERAGEIAGAGAVLKGLLFKGNPLLLYRRGTRTLKYNVSKLVEVTARGGCC